MSHWNFKKQSVCRTIRKATAGWCVYEIAATADGGGGEEVEVRTVASLPEAIEAAKELAEEDRQDDGG
jgi:hypothetical protein